MPSILAIEYADPQNLDDSIVLEYRLRQNTIVPKWLDKLKQAQQLYSIDDPTRFYGLSDQADTDAVRRINHCIAVINNFKPLINRTLDNINDQDTLNYLHHIFEVYHGLLDQQTSEFYLSAPETVRAALADLNICVHRCETVARHNYPRHVVTYFGLPKTSVLDQEDYDYSEDTWHAGTVFLNYAEIGKTVLDLAIDNDQYIADSAFQPFRHYSADFVVRFYPQTVQMAQQQQELCRNYYARHQAELGPWHASYGIGSFPLADIKGTIPLLEIQSKQYVKKVEVI